MESVIVDRKDGVVTFTLNRPQRRNAIDVSTWQLLSRELAEVAQREADRVLILTGSQDNFCAGGDLSEGSGEVPPGSSPVGVMRDTVNRFCLGLHQLAKPCIAAVEGTAAGAGANLAWGCDLVVAGRSARFGQVFVRRGLSLDSGGSWLLPRLVGLQKAKQLAFFGDWLDAEEACRLGAVTEVVDDGSALATAQALAARLVESSATALAFIKRGLDGSLENSFEACLEEEALGVHHCTQTPEFAAQLRALFQKGSR